jgi:haloalkane dehalogenase
VAGQICFLAAWQHGGMKVLRTPEVCFDNLPGFGYPPHYADVGGLRMAYVEDGPADGEPVLLLHGEPSWSFLHRKVIPVLADAGLRVRRT